MISKEDVKQVAKLARIEVSSKEEEKFSKELTLILNYIDKLNEVDTKGVEPLDQVTGIKNVIRKDENPTTASKEDKERLIGQAPSNKKGFVKVKAVLK